MDTYKYDSMEDFVEYKINHSTFENAVSKS